MQIYSVPLFPLIFFDRHVYFKSLKSQNHCMYGCWDLHMAEASQGFNKKKVIVWLIIYYTLTKNICGFFTSFYRMQVVTSFNETWAPSFYICILSHRYTHACNDKHLATFYEVLYHMRIWMYSQHRWSIISFGLY